MASARVRILHLSDLHQAVFEPWMAKFDRLRERKLRRKAPGRHDVIKALENVLRNVAQDRPPDLVCFTGDIADWGVPAEYTEATRVLDSLLGAAGAAWDRLLVVPGNHDIMRGEAVEAWRGIRDVHPSLVASVSTWMCDGGKTPPGMQEAWRDEVLKRQGGFWAWVEGRGLADLSPQRGPHGRLGYRVRRLEHLPFPFWVIGLDSAWLAGDDNDAGRLRLTPDQVGLLTSGNGGEPLPGFRLCLAHHPLGDLADGPEVRRRLEERVDLLLHGHQHRSIAEDHQHPDRGPLRILAAGSLFEGDEGRDWVNSFHVIDVDLEDGGRPARYEVTFYAWSPNGGFWHPSNAMYQNATNGRITWGVQKPCAAPGEGSAPPGAGTSRFQEYRQYLLDEHKYLGGLFREHVCNLSTVFVELDLLAEARGGRHGVEDCELLEKAAHDLGKIRGLTLRELMGLEVGRRWVVLGDPGAGKSTVARHLVWELAGNPDGPLPVYATLPELAAERCHPFDLAEERVCGGRGKADGGGLAAALKDYSTRPGKLWLFLDGLDEVAAERRPWVDQSLEQWAASLPGVTICVLSRPVGFRSPGPAYASHQARIQALTDEKQRELLKRWLGDEAKAERLCGQLGAGLRDACRVPLILSLLAYLTRFEQQVPTTRRRLFARSIQALLERGHGDGTRGVTNAEYARGVLQQLSLVLQGEAKESWTREELDARLRGLQRSDQDVRELLQSWPDPFGFLEDIGDNSGILAAHDGSAAPWRFLHRQLRELLAAGALHEQGQEAVLSRAKSLAPEEVPRWADVLGFACEMADEPLDVLRILAAANEDLALRVLPEVEGVDAVEALGVLRPDGSWDGDFLVGLFQRWSEQEGVHFDREQVCGWLWGQVTPRHSTEDLAYFHYALEHLGDAVNRERFFTQCARWPEGGPSQPRWVRIPAGTFLMGSLDVEPERRDHEGPQHPVTLSTFDLAAEAVTYAEYRQFDPSHEIHNEGRARARELGGRPVVNVSWWTAYLYCRWQGATLPTEAQWEYACRAGTRTPFSFGENITPAQVNYKGDAPYAGGKKGEFRGWTVPVGSLPPNAWGLYDMHGNVWEWCADWYGEYSAPVRAGDGLREVRRPGSRVLRGGSWPDEAQFCRSASRSGNVPSYRDAYSGFRPARVIT